MNAAERFASARRVLLDYRGDPEGAARMFRWPELDDFNWVSDWFDRVAVGNRAPALKVVEPDGSATNVSFDEMVQRSKRLARYLSRHGVKRGDRVLVMLGNVVALWDTLLAAIRIGAVIIPTSTQATSDDLDDRIARGAVRHMVGDVAAAAKLRSPERLSVRLAVGGAEGFTPYDDVLAEPAEFETVRTKATDPLLLYFTSGTTAKPKVVAHTHQSYPVGHLSTMFWLGLKEGDIHFNISAPGWAKHAWSSFFAPWNAGASIVVYEHPRFDAGRVLRVLREHQVSTLCAPPTAWRMLMLKELGTRPSALRELVSAGEPLNPQVIRAVERGWGLTVRDGYGQTETTAQCANAPGLAVKPGSMGKPLPGYDLVLLDSAGKEAAEGEVAIKLDRRPVGLMAGYVDDAERTHAAMADGYYRTGDEATRDGDGYFHFVGRGDDVFKSSDFRLSPFELESVLVACPLVAEAAVVPSPDPVRLSVPKAFVTLKPGAEPNEASAREILAFCRERLAHYKRIRILEFAELPKTISGKIRRVELRTREAGRLPGEHRPNEFFVDS